MKRVLIALSLMMLVMPATLMAAGLPNPGFEYGFENGVATGWNTYAMWTFPTCWASTDAYSGNYSQAIFNADEGGIYAQMSTKPGMDYTVSVWAKVTGGGGQGFMTIDWDGGTDPSGIDWSLWAYTVSYDEWELLTLTGTATGTTATVFFDAYAGTVLFDEFSPAADPVPEPSSLLALGTGLVGLAGIIRRRK